MIQTQTPINPGNSGGPLLDDEGELIGINSFVDSSAQGLNYAVSVDEVTRVMKMNGDRLADGSLIEAKAAESSGRDGKVQSVSQSSSDTDDYETWSYDDNNDGKPERWGVDVSGDGKPDLYLLDQDGDGQSRLRACSTAIRTASLKPASSTATRVPANATSGRSTTTRTVSRIPSDGL